MLKKILSITGKPGLFKIISHGNKTLIVEDITSKKRFPASIRDQIVSLGDIAIYTNSDDQPLGKILNEVYASQKGEPIEIKPLVAEGKLKEKFGEIVPDFDRDRVRDSDIKKLFGWYNILVGDGMKEFYTEPEQEEESTEKPEEESK